MTTSPNPHESGSSRAGRPRVQPLALLAAVLVVLSVAATAAVLLLNRSPDKEGPADSPPAPSLTASQAQELAGQLADPDPAVVAPALAEDVRAQYEAAPTPLIPAGGNLTIDPATFVPGQQPGYPTVQATAAGPQTGNFLVAQVYEDQAWHVLATVPQ